MAPVAKRFRISEAGSTSFGGNESRPSALLHARHANELFVAHESLEIIAAEKASAGWVRREDTADGMISTGTEQNLLLGAISTLSDGSQPPTLAIFDRVLHEHTALGEPAPRSPGRRT